MRSLLRFCVERPLGVLAVYAGLCGAGLICWFRLPQELLPDLRFPQLSVVTVLPNASPEEIENLVTKPVEQSVGTVKSLRRLESVSREQVSVVNVEFRWDTDMDAAMLWVQEKLGLAQDLLPLEARKPVVLRYNPFDRPVLLLSVTGTLSPEELHRLVETRLRPRLEKASGVSVVEVTGGAEREIQISLDAQKLNSRKLSILEVAEALRRRNVSRSAGTASDALFEYPVTVSGAFDTVASIREALVGWDRPSSGGRGAETAAARLGDLGTVEDGFQEPSSHARYDGRNNVSVGVYKRAEAFPVEVVRGARRALEELSRQLPPELRVDVIYDQSRYIREGISEVLANVVVGGLLAYGVLWLFLRDHRRAGIVGAAIPLALLLTIGVLYSLGMTLNLLTMGGLALGVGMLVDSSVVVMENVSRRLDAGAAADEGIVEGVEEVGGAVFFSVLTTIAAFAPIPFACVGVSQRIFTPICAAVVVSQTASLLVGFTLVPAVMSLAFRGGHGRAPSPSRKTAFGGWLAVFMARYDSALEGAVRRRRAVLAAAGAATLLSAAAMTFLVPKEVMPDVDQDQFMIKLALPAGTALETTDAVVRRIEDVLSGVPEVAHRNVIVGAPALETAGAQGPHQAQIVADLAEKVPGARGRLRRRKSCRAVMADVSRRLAEADLEGGRAELSAQGGDVFSQVFGRGGPDLTVEVKGRDLAAVKEAALGIERDLRGLKGVSRTDTSLTAPSQRLEYKMDELKLARDGLSVADAAEAALAAVHGSVPTKFRDKGREVPIRVRLQERDRKDAAALSGLMLTGPVSRTARPLTEYGVLEMAPGPSEIRRRDQARTVLVEVRLAGRRLADALPEARRVLSSRGPGKDVTAELGGEVEEMRASFRSLLYGFLAAVALVYIVLVAQFNALWIPLLALVAVPLSLNGVAPALLLTGHSLNLMSGQGLMILAGIVVNNSLMLLEFVQQGRTEGKSPEKAALDASRTRLRPIFMTVIGNLAGLLPLALGLGRGAEMQAPMAVTVVFGLLVSTVLTLIVLPAAYLEARRLFER